MAKTTQVLDTGVFDDGRFAAPELITRPLVAGTRCDVFGAGAVLYFLLTARPPFEAVPGGQLPRRAFRREAADPREVNPQVPEGIARVVGTAMSQYVDRRYATPREMLAELDKELRALPN